MDDNPSTRSDAPNERSPYSPPQTKETLSPSRNESPFKNLFLKGVVGAVLGGAVGYGLFSLLVKQGLYVPMMPGALLGIGCGMLHRGRSIPLGVFSAVVAIPLGIYSEWSLFPFVKDESLSFFLANLGALPKSTLLFFALGAIIAYWFGKGR